MPKRKARHNLQLRRRTPFISSKAKPLTRGLALGPDLGTVLGTVLGPVLGMVLGLAPGLVLSQDLGAAEVTEQYIDWVPRSELTAEELEQLAPFCRGVFREPEMNHDEADLDPKLAPIRIEAGRTSVTNGSKIRLEGDVDIIQGARSLHADQISYDRVTANASLVGEVTIRQPGTLIRGEEAHLHMDSNQARFVEAQFLLHGQHLRGGAESIEQTEDKVIILTNGRITSCEPVEESWVLEGGKLIIDPVEGQGSGRNLVLRFGGVPILYLPYIRFPLGEQRQSGFLFPVAGYNESNGLDLAIPYYFNLAPNYDLLLTPRYISQRGAMLEAQGRHLSRLFETQVDLALLANDRGSDDPDYQAIIDSGAATEGELQPYVGEDRWLARINQSGGRDQRWHSQIDYSAVSDLDYFRDLDTASFSVSNSTYLNQSAELGYTLPNWTLKARLQDYQTLLRGLDETYRQLPRVDVDGLYHWGDLYLQMNNEYVNFDHSQAFRSDGSSIITGQRARSDYRLSWDKQWQWGYFKPQVGIQHLRYQLDENSLRPGDSNSINLTAQQAAIDLGLIFDRSDLTTGRLQQTLEPRLYYLYREYADHSELFGLTAAGQAVNFDTTALNFTYSQLFRDTRFSGGDRIDDADQLAMGLTSRWYGGADNRELVTASIGQIYHFADRRVTLRGEPETFSRSEIATQVNASLTDNLDLRADFLINDKNANVSRGSIFGHYADERRLFNLGYRFISADAVGATSIEDVKQLDFSFSTSVSSQWQAVGRINYDITDRRELEAFAGFEYNDCCYRLRVLARRWLDSKIADLITDNDLQYDQGIFFEIQLKGLGGTGDRVRTLLEDSIVGWREHQPNSYH